MVQAIELEGRQSAGCPGQKMKEAQNHIRKYLAEIGKRGGCASRRELTKSHARKMVAIREMKRAAVKAGKRWPPKNRKPLKLS
jgi:hypothetical protein